MSSNVIILPFPQPRNEAAELLQIVERYGSDGKLAEHIDDTLAEVQEAIGGALFLHIKPVLQEVMFNFAFECRAIGVARSAIRRQNKEEDKKITPIVGKR